MPKLDLDAIDRRLLDALQDEARLSNVDLAERVGLSASPCLRRVKILEREGVILTQHGKGSTVAPDPGLGQRLYDEELAAHIEQVARLGALLGLGPDELASRVQEATDQFISARLASQGAPAAGTTKERV